MPSGRSAIDRLKVLVAALPLIAAGSACRQGNEFTEKTPVVQPAPTGNGPAASAESIVTGEGKTLPGDVLVPCDASSPAAGSERAQPSQRLQIPLQCMVSRTVSGRADGLDIVFVLDVTGSMRSQLDVVRDGFAYLVDRLTEANWDFRLGAVAFADSILDQIPLTSDAQKVVAGMAASKPAWSAPPGFGGDTPEVGLGAIEAALQLLSVDEGAHGAWDKIILYVSDAPALVAHTGGSFYSENSFSVQTSAAKARAFAKLTEGRGGLLRFFYSSSPGRKNLRDEMPTPIHQLESFVRVAEIAGLPLSYPLSSQSFSGNFVDKLREGKVVSEGCSLAGIVVWGQSGEKILSSQPGAKSPSDSQGYFTLAFPTPPPPGKYVVEIQRSCGKAQEPHSSRIDVEL